MKLKVQIDDKVQNVAEFQLYPSFDKERHFPNKAQTLIKNLSVMQHNYLNATKSN